jgi:DNA primase
MKLAEIKSKYSMIDILARYNIKVTKGFCKCSLHKGDNTPSMKVYKDGFYCFGCGAGGDFIKFVQLHDHLTFEEACKWISGEELERKTKYQLAVAKVRRKNNEQNNTKCTETLAVVSNQLAPLWQKYLASEPLSDEWCEAYNQWQKLVYKQENLIEQLREK